MSARLGPSRLRRLLICVFLLLIFRLADEEVADSELVSDNDVGEAHPLLSLLVRILVAVQLGVNGTELETQATFKFEFMDAGRDTLVLQRFILLVVQLFRTRLETQGALLELTKFLVAHCHVVEDLERDVRVARAPGQVNYVEDAVSFLKEQEGVIKLFLLDVDKSALIQLKQHHRYFIYTKLELTQLTLCAYLPPL